MWDLSGFSGAGVDFLFAFGQVKLVTRQNFSAIRRGNTIIVKGTVIHLWREKYDFDEATDTPESGLLTGAAIVAEEGGRAQKFLIALGLDPERRGDGDDRERYADQSATALVGQ